MRGLSENEERAVMDVLIAYQKGFRYLPHEQIAPRSRLTYTNLAKRGLLREVEGGFTLPDPCESIDSQPPHDPATDAEHGNETAR